MARPGLFLNVHTPFTRAVGSPRTDWMHFMPDSDYLLIAGGRSSPLGLPAAIPLRAQVIFLVKVGLCPTYQ